MKPLRVLSIFGTRPEAVKMAPVIQALSASLEIESCVCVTAQHREMLDQVLSLFKIKPDYDLNLMKPNQTLAHLTADILTHLDQVLADAWPLFIAAFELDMLRQGCGLAIKGSLFLRKLTGELQVSWQICILRPLP
jgi:UDP-N-acetylglucosamine 2-epimerase